MKLKLPLIFLLLLLGVKLQAQFALENTYPGTSSFSYSGNSQQLYIIKLEVDGEKYVHIDRINKNLNFYNLNHSFWKTISFASTIDLNPSANVQGILYISQHLFDLDDEIEFLYSDMNGPGMVVTQIVDENGTVLFTANNCAPVVLIYVPQGQVPIYNTPVGTKMILSCTDSSSKVYGLPGVLSALINPNPIESAIPLSIYPNPSSEKITLENGRTLINKIFLIDERGNRIREIENMKDKSIELNVSTLAVGIYFIQAIDEHGIVIETKKFVKQ